MNKEKNNAKARLENLSVREVSIVDKPANQRRFLLVKKASGEASNEVLNLLKTEEHAMRRAIVPSQAAQHGIVVNEDTSGNHEPVEKNAEFSSFLDVLGIIDDNAEDSERSEEDEETSANIETELIPITKDVKQTALGAATKILESFMASVNQAKNDGEVTDKIKSSLQNIAQSVKNLTSRLGGKETNNDQPTDKGDDISKLTAALEKLIVIVDKIKKLDDSVDQVPEDIIRELNAFSTALASMLQTQEKEPPKDEKQEKSQVGTGDTAVEIFTRDIENDVAVVLKAGSKMSKSRLSSLKKAIDILSSIVTEIEGSTEDKKDDKKDVKKAETPPQPAIDESKIVAEVKKSLGEEITKQLKELGDKVSSQFAAIKKRIDDVEDARPAGNTDFDPPAKVEKKGSLFSNIIQI